MTKSITYEVTVNQGGTFWKLNGNYHREDGPAIESVAGNKFWFINGEYHRTDGPELNMLMVPKNGISMMNC